MYLLGHVAIGYITAWLVARSRKQTLILWAVFTVSILPDLDYLLAFTGLRHGTYTHSLILIGALAAILFIWNRKTLPYLGALFSHIFADFLIGPVGLFLPLSRTTISLNLQMSSRADALLEIGSLLVMLLTLWRGGDLKRLLQSNRDNLLLVIPIAVLSASLLRATSRIFILRGFTIIGYSTAALPLTAIVIGHIILLSLLTYSLIKAFLARDSIHVKF